MHRHVGMADEAERGLLEGEVAEGGLGGVEIFPDGPAEGAVNEGDVISSLNFGQGVEEGAFVWRQAGLRPLRGGGGIRVEVLGADGAGGRALVVAGDHHGVESLQTRDALSRLGAVAYAVPQGPDGVDWGALPSIAEDGFEGVEVGVDVGDDESAHMGAVYRMGARIIAPWVGARSQEPEARESRAESRSWGNSA